MYSSDSVIKKLNSREVGLLPSDTIYGLSCRALDEKAVRRLYELKGRTFDKSCIILISSVDQAQELGIDSKSLSPATKYWPAPLTVIVQAPKTPDWLTRSRGTLALRIPDNAKLRQLIKKTGPIISTSANLQGQHPAKTVEEARGYFSDKLDFYVDGGELSEKPSTIAKIVNGRLEIVRSGPFKINA